MKNVLIAGGQYRKTSDYSSVGLPGGIDGIDCIFYDAYGAASIGTYPSNIGIAERLDTTRQNEQYCFLRPINR